MKVLIVYGSDQGQTRRIATRIGQILTEAGNTVDMLDGRTLPADLSLTKYDAVIIGASVHTFKFQSYIEAFVKLHRHQLRRMPTAFFSVSLWEACPDPSEHVRLTQVINSFLEEVSWQPDTVVSFAGAIPRTTGGSWFMRRVVWRRIKRNGVATNTTAYEYTDWEAVAHFADEFTVQAESRLTTAAERKTSI